MSKPTRSIRTKVTLGYILLIAILLFSVWYIYGEMKQLSAPDQYETELNEKRKATNNVLALLYQAEIIGQSLSTGRLTDYPLYRKSVMNIQMSIDSLKIFVTDSLQLLRIDSISFLLIQKDRNMISLLKTISESSTDKLYRQNLEHVITQQDSLFTQQQVKRKEIVKNNSYTVRKKPKKFFKRLKEVFAPDKKDSTTITNISKEFVTDTLAQAYNPADTVVTILKNIQTKVSDKQQEVKEKLRYRSDIIRYNGLIISNKINRIINDFEEEEMNRSLNKLEYEKDIRQQSIRTIAWIAIIAVLLSIGFLILIWRDITRSNHYRSELEIAKKKAEELLIAREKLMLTITHDIKAPVGSIMGYADLLARLTKEERQLFYLANMKSSSEHLLRLVNDLLDFHRLESNKMEVNRVNFNPHQLFDETVTSFKPIAARKKLDLHIQIDEKLNGHFISDPFRIRQIMSNLLSNALKFTRKGNITLSATYKNAQLYFSVTDTGCGIPEEEQTNIFQEFTRLKNAQGEEGFGLGLSITQKLAILLEGTISVTSTPGQGSTFIVQIPLYPVNHKSAIAPPPKPELPVAEKELNVLVIDDDRIQLNLTEAMLNKLKISVICCDFPEELFKLLKSHTFDLLLTDVQMPAMNGFELLSQLRESNIPQARTIPVIAVTARSDMSRESFLSQGFAGCLHKPFSLNELYDTLQLNSNSTVQTEQRREEKILDFSALTAFSENDPLAATEIIQTFATETEKSQYKLKEALLNKNMQEIAAIAHKLLPLFILIHASDCIESLQWLEKQREVNTFTEEANQKTIFVLEKIENVVSTAKMYSKA